MAYGSLSARDQGVQDTGRASTEPTEASQEYKKLSVLIPYDIHRELKTFAFKNQTTITNIILSMIADLLSTDELPKPRDLQTESGPEDLDIAS